MSRFRLWRKLTRWFCRGLVDWREVPPPNVRSSRAQHPLSNYW